MVDFRESVLELGAKGVNIMNEYFDGRRQGTDLVKEAGTMIREAVKVSNRNQMDLQVKRSQAIRLISFIPQEHRAEYIALSAPEAKPFLLSRPKKKD